MILNLYKTTDKHNVINKKLTEPLEININLKRTENQESPRLLLKNDNNKYKGYNYAYIDFFKRYYFIESTSNNNDKIIELQLETDVLETYKDDILNAKATTLDYYSNEGIISAKKRKDIYNSNITLENAETMLMSVITGGLNNDQN